MSDEIKVRRDGKGAVKELVEISERSLNIAG
jgi:hypothetical protein